MVRIMVVGLLLVGPWTDEPAELAGWDAERFQEIVDRDGAAWVDRPIEYPPGSVVLLDRLAGDDVVSTNRRLIAASTLLEAAAVLMLWRTVGAAAAKGFLVLGLPLVPMGLMRLDMAVTVVAAAAAVVLLTGIDGRRRQSPRGPERSRMPERSRIEALTGAGFAALVAVGAMIKIWPALLVAGAWAIGRRGAAVAAAVATGISGVVWLVVVDGGVAPVTQVSSLRGATGWHVESLPGTLVALFTGAAPRLELNAFRIGTLSDQVVTLGRLLTLAVIGGSVAAAVRRERGDATRTLALVMLASTSALLITAPLLSPQFLLWLTPWGALLLADGATGTTAGQRAPDSMVAAVVTLLGVAVVLTGFTLTVFGPERMADGGPALLLTARNLALLAIPPACLTALAARQRSERAESDLVER